MPSLPITHRDPPPVLVIGSGIAGLLTALRSAAHGPVLLITKDELGHSNTRQAQGGIAAAVAVDDSPAAHAADTLAAGAGLCDPDAVSITTEDGPRRIAELTRLGVPFDMRDGRLELGREAAHGAHRVVHAGGDATGANVVAALRDAVLRDPRISIRPHLRVVDLVVEAAVAVGVLVSDRQGRVEMLRGRAVVLATGGLGQLYAYTTNPRGATGDGIALAMRAGAAVADLEMVQFHPTALALGPSPLPLVSEAVRGEGAYLRDAAGRRFMRDLHPLAELAPRDVVARAVARTALDDGQPVTLDLRHLDAAHIERRFPTIADICATHGLRLAHDPIPVTPAAHYGIGGVLADMTGRTSLRGLYAVGEVACTGLHGANRLASNSLLEGAVMAARAAAHIGRIGIDDWPARDVRPTTLTSGHGPVPAQEQIQELMWRGLGLERDEAGMADLADTLAGFGPSPEAGVDGMVLVARAMVRAGRHRTESRGAHFRTDHPSTDEQLAHRIGWLDGTPFVVEPATPLTRVPHQTVRNAA
ncbi:MAG: L-aspartate oxidase [Actinobacteria bacterium]|nr:L-aspartate oxidase [Actinomycetota bacterium]